VLALVAGIAGYVLLPDSKAPVRDRAPFFLAVAALSREPAVHYSGALPDGTSWDMEATSGGQQLGKVIVGGQQIGILVVDGVTYIKPPAGMVDSLLPAGLPADAVRGKWVTGADGLASALPRTPASPLALASSLFGALEQTTDFPVVGAPRTEVGGVPAESVTTPAGVLTVSADPPYHVLRLASATASPNRIARGSSADTTYRTPGPVPQRAIRTDSAMLLSAHGGFVPGRAVTAARFAVDATSNVMDGQGQTDFIPMSGADDSQMFSTLEGETSDTSGAVDAGVTTSVQGSGSLSCSTSGCMVTDEVSTSSTSSAGAQLSGTVTAKMTATVTVQGAAAGECSAQASMAVNASTTITCEDAQAGSVIEQDQAQAQQQADATGESIDQVLDCLASVEVYAEAAIEAQVQQEVSSEKAEQRADEQAATENQNAVPGAVTQAEEAALNNAMAQADPGPGGAPATSPAPDPGSELQQLGSRGSYNILLGISSPAFQDLTESEGLENLMSYSTADARDLFLMILYGNPDAKWSVSLDGFDGDTVESKFMNAALTGARSPMNSVTQWEMAQLYDVKGNGRYGNNTLGGITFFENGKKVPNPWASSTG